MLVNTSYVPLCVFSFFDLEGLRFNLPVAFVAMLPRRPVFHDEGGMPAVERARRAAERTRRLLRGLPSEEAPSSVVLGYVAPSATRGSMALRSPSSPASAPTFRAVEEALRRAPSMGAGVALVGESDARRSVFGGLEDDGDADSDSTSSGRASLSEDHSPTTSTAELPSLFLGARAVALRSTATDRPRDGGLGEALASYTFRSGATPGLAHPGGFDG